MTIEFRREGKIAIFTINNQSTMNALDNLSLNEIQQLLIDFNNDPDLWAGIITGKGDVAFCSGFDLGEFSKTSLSTRHLVCTVNPIRELEITKPLIAAVNGAALGGGLELMLICDLRVASDKAVFGFPEVKLGFIPAWGGTQQLARQITRCQAAELLFTGNNIDAQTALRFGLINRMEPQEQVLQAAINLAESVCKAAPLAVRAAKEAMLKGLQVSLEEGLQIEEALNILLKNSEDFREGIDAFQEKRQPRFTGD
jgi:enoyl-CoA hydratase/carnithine racemase